MNLTAQIKSILEQRIKRLERMNEELTGNFEKEDDRILMHIYFENEAKLSELYSLLEFVTEKMVNDEA